jgi:hypothetical protein
MDPHILDLGTEGVEQSPFLPSYLGELCIGDWLGSISVMIVVTNRSTATATAKE